MKARSVATRASVVAAMLVAIAASCAPMWWIFGTPQLIVAVGASMLVGTLIAALGAVRYWSWPWLFVAGSLAFAVLAAPLAAPQLIADGQLLRAFLDCMAAVVLSWRRILTVGLPIGVDDALLVAPILLVLSGTLVAIRVALRSRRAELGVLAPLIIGVWGVLWGPRDVPDAWLTGLLAIIPMIAYVMLVRQARRRSREPRSLSTLARRTLAGSLVAVISAGAAAAVGYAAPLPERVVLRGETPASVVERGPSPLASYRSYWKNGNDTAVQLTATGLEPGDRIRLASLESYDGSVLSDDGAAFERVAVAEEGRGRVVGITIGDLEGRWLPTVGTPSGIRFVGPRSDDLANGLYRDAALESLVVTPGLGEGDAVQMLVEPGVPIASGADIAALEPAETRLPEATVPEEMITALSAWTSEAGTLGEQLAALVQGIRSDGYVSHGSSETEAPSRAGHSLQRLEELFAEPMIGDAEQYATAAMLLARQLGFDARVVVGFTPDDIVPGAPTPVVGADADAWIEVRTPSGWVGIDVTPEPRPIPDQTVGTPGVVLEPPAQQAPAPPPFGQESGVDPAPPSSPTTPEPDESRLGAAIWAAVAVSSLFALVAAIPVGLMLAKVVRRRRRKRAADTRDRADGAWAEVSDALLDRGVTFDDAETRTEQAGDNDAMRELAVRVDRAVFAPAAPSEAEALETWALAASVVRAHDSSRGFGAKLFAWLNPASVARR